MSKKLKDNKAFIYLLLTSDRKDVREILTSANKIQLQILAEIFYYLIFRPLNDSRIYTKQSN